MLKAGKSVAEAAAILESQLQTNANSANSFTFVCAFFASFEGLSGLPSAFRDLETQDWANIKYDCKEMLRMSAASSRGSLEASKRLSGQCNQQ